MSSSMGWVDYLQACTGSAPSPFLSTLFRRVFASSACRHHFPPPGTQHGCSSAPFDTRVNQYLAICRVSKMTLQWYHYIATFFAGVFLTNSLPHLLHGLSGNKFPTPFAKPHGKGLSPAVLNTLWGLLNFGIGYVLIFVGLGHMLSKDSIFFLLTLLLGAAAISIPLSWHFTRKDREPCTCHVEVIPSDGN